MNERRQARRFEPHVVAKIVVEGTDSYGRVHDLSLDGMQVSCDRDIQLETSVQVVLNLSEKEFVSLLGKIVWRKDSPDINGGAYRYGVQLEKKGAQYEKYIESHLPAAR